MGGDGCTGWLDGWWRHCCAAHDQQYLDRADKIIADIDLFTCVATSGTVWWQHLLSGAIAVTMFAGVSIFGWLFYKSRKNKA